MKRFALQVAIVFVVIGLLAAWPLVRYASDAVIIAAVTGAVMSTVNVLVGFLAIQHDVQQVVHDVPEGGAGRDGHPDGV